MVENKVQRVVETNVSSDYLIAEEMILTPSE